MKCGICGKEFKEDQIEEYSKHVQQCCLKVTEKKKSEDMKKINAQLEELKRAKVYYEGLRDNFKEKYPDIYASNFSENKENKTTAKSSYKMSEDEREHINRLNNFSKMFGLGFTLDLDDED